MVGARLRSPTYTEGMCRAITLPDPHADLPDPLVQIATTQIHRQGDPVHRCKWQNSVMPSLRERLQVGDGVDRQGR